MANINIPVPATRDGHSKLIDPGIKKIWNDQYKQLAPKMGLVVNVQNMSSAYEEEAGYSGLGDVPEVGEAEPYAEDGVMHTYDTTYRPVKYGVTIPVSYELYDDQFEKIAGKTALAAKAVARKIEKIASSLYNNGFDTAYTSYGDGKPVFSTLHPNAFGGAVHVNASSVGAVLSDESLETMILLMRNSRDDRDELVDLVPDTILVPAALEGSAIRITKSEQRSNTADNDANIHNMAEYTGGKLKVVSWNYLGSVNGGSDTAYFLIDSSVNPLTWKWREKPQIVKLPDAVGALKDLWYWKARFRAAIGWSNFRGVVGSKGDGQAYAS